MVLVAGEVEMLVNVGVFDDPSARSHRLLGEKRVPIIRASV